MQQQLTQMVPALRPLEIVVAILRLLVKTPAANPYSVSFARSCMGGQLLLIHPSSLCTFTEIRCFNSSTYS